MIHIYAEMVVLMLSKILLQTRCENRYNNSQVGSEKNREVVFNVLNVLKFIEFL